MTQRKNLGKGIETLEKRAAPSTLLGTGLSLGIAGLGTGLMDSKVDTSPFGAKQPESGYVAKPTPGFGSKADHESPDDLQAKPQSILGAVLTARSAARKGSSEDTGQHAGARSVSMDTTHVFDLATGEVVDSASSTLRRTPNGITATLETSELEPGHTYTLWVVAFNHPEECVDGCNAGDVGNPDVAATIAFGAGHVVGDTGQATFSAHLQEGDTSRFPPEFSGIFAGEDIGLIDSDKAEIHLVVRDHGEPIPGQVAEQIGRFSGGCDINDCVDVQAAVHVA